MTALCLFLTSNALSCSSRYDCGDATFGDAKCGTEDATNNLFNYLLTPCANNTKTCPYSNLDPVTNKQVGCVDIKTSTAAYPGQACTDKTTCFNGACVAGICTGKNETTVCATHSECNAGLSCYSNGTASVCRAQAVADTGVCTDDNDCVNTAGCFNGKCKKYFSAALGDTVSHLAGDLSFCASGLSVNNVCVSRTNAGEDPFVCTDATPCTYTLSDKTTVTDPKACACSRGTTGKSYCALGNGMQQYVDYITAFKNYLQKSQDLKCHTVERDSCPIVKKSDVNSFNTFDTAKVVAKNFHIMRDAKDCVIKTMYPQWASKPVSAPSCPSVTCGKLPTDQCASYVVGSPKNNLTAQTCASGKYCQISPDFFMNTTAFNTTCSTASTDAVKVRFPGEKCDKTFDCRDPNKCESGKCTGKKLAETCDSDADCLVGSYCNITNVANKTCLAQLAADAATCTRDAECQNSQGCLKGKCTNWYSQALGADVGTTTQRAGALCKSGQVIANNSCVGLAYDGMTADKDAGLVKCVFGSKCNYTDNFGSKSSEDCQCSFDKNGSTFCRKAYDETNKDWTSLSDAYKSKLSVKTCHTVNRGNCGDDSSFKTNVYNARVVTDLAHELRYSDDCIKKQFAAGEYIRYSVVILAALLISLI